MNYLVKNVLILDKKSPYFRKNVDFLVSEGKIIEISKSIALPKSFTIVEGKRLILCTALVDINVESGEPSTTEAESISSLLLAATKGGFAYIAHQPSPRTPIENKSTVQYLQSENKGSVTQILPIGNIVQSSNSHKMTELMEMRDAGAKAFSSGNHQSIMLNTLSHALQYATGFQGKLMVHPEKKELTKNGQINQGKMSVMLGYKGMPLEAESIAVNEILEISEYQNSEILLLNITSPLSIERIKKANKSNKKVYSSTSSMHILLSENEVVEYNTNYKLSPPLRSDRDIKKLRKAILERDIDIIYSQHTPRTSEDKNLEFDHAEFGAINLQTSFSACLTTLGSENIELIIEIMSTNPANYLGLEMPIFDKKVSGNYTLIDLGDQTIFTKDDNSSKSQNSPFFDRPLEGKIRGLIAHNSQIFF